MLLRRFVLGELGTNTYVVADRPGGSALLIDPAAASQDVMDYLGREALSVVYILNTHGHVDHVAGDRFFKQRTGAMLLIHQADSEMLRLAAEQAAFFGTDAEAQPEPDLLLEGGEELEIGGVAGTIHHTPGHSPGSICLRLDQEIFVGDLIFAGSVGRTDLPGGSYRALLESIHSTLLCLPDSFRLYPGHGPETTVGIERRSNPFLEG